MNPAPSSSALATDSNAGVIGCDALLSVAPYYERGGITIYHADARDVIDMLPDGLVLLTDPVYGINGGKGGDAKDYRKGGYQMDGWADTEEYVQSVCVPVVQALLAKCVRAAVTPGIRCLNFYPRPVDMGCLWTPAACTHGPWGFTTMQPILYYGKDFRAGKGALPSGRAVTEASEKNGHPCPKPLSAWTWLMDKVSQQEETILDPFMGSGTTLRAAKDLNRKAIGIEISERYCEIAARRLAQDVLPLFSDNSFIKSLCV